MSSPQVLAQFKQIVMSCRASCQLSEVWTFLKLFFYLARSASMALFRHSICYCCLAATFTAMALINTQLRSTLITCHLESLWESSGSSFPKPWKASFDFEAGGRGELSLSSHYSSSSAARDYCWTCREACLTSQIAAIAKSKHYSSLCYLSPPSAFAAIVGRCLASRMMSYGFRSELLWLVDGNCHPPSMLIWGFLFRGLLCRASYF